MSVSTVLKSYFEQQEHSTVSDAFGGPLTNGRTPSFSVANLTDCAIETFSSFPDEDIALSYDHLTRRLGDSQSRYLLQAAIRFSFLIELTNLKITSTKMKTRWLPGFIMKVAPGTFTNIKGTFAEGSDPRASSYETCFDIFVAVLQSLVLPEAKPHLDTVVSLSVSAARSVPYEFVFTYREPHASQPHTQNNIRLVNLEHLSWLIKARPIYGNILSESSFKKIEVKSFLTDRAQTGADQTNRAKRWEVISQDFQHASLEDCWSVQRKLLESLIGFANFPDHHRRALQQSGLVGEHVPETLCPITLVHLDFESFQRTTEHGHSAHQVGHLKPLKSGGQHTGTNVAWVTDHGNRIQGDNDIDATHQLLRDIHRRMVANGL